MRFKCERLDDYGRGIGYIDNKIVFVSGVLPGEEATICIKKDKRKYMEGEIVNLDKRSIMRVCPDCPYSFCGCSLNIMNYSDTLKYKKEKVLNILKKYGDIELSDISIISGDIYGYRNKITLKVRDGKLGYYRNGTHDLISISKCLIVSDRINEIVEVLNTMDLSQVREIVVKAMDEIMIIVDGSLDIDRLKNISDSIYMNGKLVYGKTKILSHIGSYRFYVSKDSFFQVNDSVTFKLYDKLIDYVGSGGKAVDLFCGCGTISMFLSDRFEEIVGVEINRESIEMANLNMKLNNKSNIIFKCGDANKIFGELDCDVLVVDPARSGLSKVGINNILDIKPSKIVYVSCNPISLARDLKLLSDRYFVKDITLFDMFPWTYHVESVCLLERK